MPRQSTPDAPKTCPVCGTIFSRHPHEKRSNYQRRKTCGKECGQELTHRQQRRTLAGRVCVVCGETFHRRRNEQSPHFLKRQTCGPDCRKAIHGPTVSASRGLRRAERLAAATGHICVVCGTSYTPPIRASIERFERRQTCGKRCTGILAGRNFRASLGADYASTDYPSAWVVPLRDAIRERDGHICRACGASPKPDRRGKVIQHHVHHIDWDKANCAPANLITLCPTCHKRAHRQAEKDAWILFLQDMTC